MGSLIGVIIVVVVLFLLLVNTLFTVKTQTAVIIQRFGKFVRVAKPGLNAKIPFIDQKVFVVTLRVQQLDMTIETKTKDNIFTKVVVSVQFFVPDNDDSIQKSFYRLSRPEQQLTSYVYDSVRAKVPSMNLDEAFESKQEIADKVKSDLQDEMTGYGYSIRAVLVTDLDPDQAVKIAMNNINISQRNQTAAAYQGEADKITVVKQAEAQAESKRLQGVGIAQQRLAIAEGMRSSVDQLKAAGISEEKVWQVLLANQYFDVMGDLRAQGATTVFLPGGADAVGNISQQLITSLVSANAVEKAKPLAGDAEEIRARKAAMARAPKAGPQRPAAK